jgi:hypothetical protein
MKLTCEFSKLGATVPLTPSDPPIDELTSAGSCPGQLYSTNEERGLTSSAVDTEQKARRRPLPVCLDDRDGHEEDSSEASDPRPNDTLVDTRSSDLQSVGRTPAWLGEPRSTEIKYRIHYYDHITYHPWLPDTALLRRRKLAIRKGPMRSLLSPTWFTNRLKFRLDSSRFIHNVPVLSSRRRKLDDLLDELMCNSAWGYDAVLHLSPRSGPAAWNASLECLEKSQRQADELNTSHDDWMQTLLKLSGWLLEVQAVQQYPGMDDGRDSVPESTQVQSGSPDVFEEPTASGHLPDIGTNALPERTQTQAKYAGIFEEPSISGRLQGTDVLAFPDTGAATNYISLPYTQCHGLEINKVVQRSVKVGDGSLISVIGTTTLPFSFAGESTKHNLTFHVLRNSVHDIILGSPFLRATETFTRFAHRVGRKVRESVSHSVHRICFLGSEQYVNGLASGVRVDAVPDTGADVSVMSAEFAKANGFEVNDDKQHQILLEFADGSTARAQGVVTDVAWEFGADEKTSPTDVYVLSSLPVDLVLGFGFLCQTEAFQEHWHNFWNIEDSKQDDAGMFCIIRVLKDAGEETSREYRCGVTPIWRLDI